MIIVTMVVVLVLSTVLCIIEIPDMLKSKSYKDLWTFFILLAFGITLTALRSVDLLILNPADLLAWIFSPVSDAFRNFLNNY